VASGFRNGAEPVIGLEAGGVEKRHEPGNPALPGLNFNPWARMYTSQALMMIRDRCTT